VKYFRNEKERAERRQTSKLFKRRNAKCCFKIKQRKIKPVERKKILIPIKNPEFARSNFSRTEIKNGYPSGNRLG